MEWWLSNLIAYIPLNPTLTYLSFCYCVIDFFLWKIFNLLKDVLNNYIIFVLYYIAMKEENIWNRKKEKIKKENRNKPQFI